MSIQAGKCSCNSRCHSSMISAYTGWIVFCIRCALKNTLTVLPMLRSMIFAFAGWRWCFIMVTIAYIWYGKTHFFGLWYLISNMLMLHASRQLSSGSRSVNIGARLRSCWISVDLPAAKSFGHKINIHTHTLIQAWIVCECVNKVNRQHPWM